MQQDPPAAAELQLVNLFKLHPVTTMLSLQQPISQVCAMLVCQECSSCFLGSHGRCLNIDALNDRQPNVDSIADSPEHSSPPTPSVCSAFAPTPAQAAVGQRHYLPHPCLQHTASSQLLLDRQLQHHKRDSDTNLALCSSPPDSYLPSISTIAHTFIPTL